MEQIWRPGFGQGHRQWQKGKMQNGFYILNNFKALESTGIDQKCRHCLAPIAGTSMPNDFQGISSRTRQWPRFLPFRMG